MGKIAETLYKRPFGLFIIFLLIAYLPVLLPFFHLKNDILTQNLPTRFVFSESIYSGFEPFWNPYLNFGTPQYGDMNNGFWNPVQWIIGSTTGYNIYSITLEEIFYILIGGWGIYKVCSEFLSKEIALVTGLVYMTCGYVTGHLQYLCWITAVGYFPYVILFFLRTNKSPILKNYFAGGLSVFLFTASSHPGLIIGAAYFFFFLLLIIFFNREDFMKKFYHKKFWIINILFFLFSCLLSTVVIFSNIDVLQHISRGDKVTLEQTLMHPTTFQSYISLLFPLPVHKSDFFRTDIGMRNTYIGLFHILGLIFAFLYLTKRQLLSILIPLLFFIFLSAGGHFKVFVWKVLPLLGYVRLNGEFTYFVILLLLLIGAGGLEKLIRENTWQQKASRLVSISTIITFCVIVASLLAVIFYNNYSINITGQNLKEKIKDIVNNSNFWQLLFVQAAIQTATLLLIRKYLNQKVTLVLLTSINLVIITWLIMPFTGVGMMSKKEVQQVLNTFPRGIQPQELLAINKTKYINPHDESQFLLIASYSKKIGHLKPDQYPVQLKSNNDLITDTTLFSFIKQQAFLFLSTDTVINTQTNYDSSYIRVIKSGPGYTKCIIINSKYNWLTLLQNNYPYWRVKVNGNLVKHFTSFKSFISIPIENGTYEVEFNFETTRIKAFMWVNITLLLTAIILLLLPKVCNRTFFK